MRTTQLVNVRGTVINRIHDCRQINSAGDSTGKVERTCIRIQIRKSTQSMGIRHHAEGNRPDHQILDLGQDMRWKVRWNIGKRRPSSHHSIPKKSLYAPGVQTHLPTGEICIHSLKSGTAAAPLQAVCDSLFKLEVIPSSGFCIFKSGAATARKEALTSSKKSPQRH